MFLLFYVKDLLTTGKNSWKAANSTSKGSTSNHFKWLFQQGMVEKQESHWNKKFSEAYLEPSQRSMMEPFRVNS